MPTTYAHWRFGDRCIKTLPENLQTIINNNRKIFDFGVHGPDIFFYYDCIKSNEVNKFGSSFHNIPFEKSLIKMKEGYLKAQDKESVLSYLLGFLAHFALDSYCHGYIDHKAESQPISHGTIESQLDRYYLIKDGYNPVKKSVTFSLKPNKKIAHDIALVFPDIEEKIVYKAIKDQLFYLNLLKDNNDVKRSLLKKIMDIVHAPAYKDLLITKENNPMCKDSNERCNKYFNKAVEHYPILANSLIEYLDNDKDLNAYFHNTFNPKEDYKNIPLLSYEEELKYEIKYFQD